MATKKDLTEAYAFSRRRLVTAFVSGAPGGREVEPARPGRTIVGGLALAVLLVAGAAVAGVFSPRVDEEWASQPGLIISKESGAAYVITEVEEGEEPILRPVINITSAKLILGASATPTIIPDEYINRERRGDDIGILDAPANVPGTDALIDDGWTACTGETTGIRLHVSREPAVELPVANGALLVEVEDGDDGAVHVVAPGPDEATEHPRAYSYRVPAGKDRDNLLGALGLPEGADSAVPVPEEWLALFPPGGELTRDTFGVEGAGSAVAYADAAGGLSGAEVGDVVDTGSEQLLLRQDGPEDLSEFEAAVYLNTGDERVISLTEPPAVSRSTEEPADAHWPTGGVTPVDGEQCAQLLASPGQRPGVRIVAAPVEDASSLDVEDGKRSVVVAEGAGAYVLSGAWDQTTGGAPHLLDATGRRYPLVGSDAPSLLGFGEYAAPNVPDPWVELLRTGVALSRNAALCPPGTDVGDSCA